MKGGMLMLSDMFNHALKARVDALCRDISVILASEPGLFVADAGRWPPPELGRPSATGSQNQVRYAYFDRARRLAVEVSGRVSVYDTLDHHIRGFSQQQGGTGTLLFTSQRGTVELSTLPLVSVDGRPAPQPEPGSGTSSKFGEDAFAAIERLGKLHADGLLTDEEFADKKAELLRRI
jgi:hypothetical protein